MLSDEEIVRLYGPWVRRTPRDATELLAEYSGRWWIAGGWAIDAYVGTTREHGDLDIGVPRADKGLFLDFVAGRLDAWAASAGSLTPVVPGDPLSLSDACDNLWLRSRGAEPWEYEVLLERVDGDTWTYKRDPAISRPLIDCLWRKDGLTYLRPEVQLLLKSAHVRQKDTLDLERTLPQLDAVHRQWLAEALRSCHPEHPWRMLLDRA